MSSKVGPATDKTEVSFMDTSLLVNEASVDSLLYLNLDLKIDGFIWSRFIPLSTWGSSLEYKSYELIESLVFKEKESLIVFISFNTFVVAGSFLGITSDPWEYLSVCMMSSVFN